MNDLSSRLHVAARMAHIAPFEVMEIQKLAREVEAHGHDVVRLEIGEPDFRTPAPVVEAAKRALDARPMFYTSALGLPELREAISGFYQSRYGVAVPASRIAVTAGSSGALLLAFGVLLDPGDAVLLADPGYPCNRHFMRALGAVPRPVAVGPQTGYQLTEALARRHWDASTRMAMVASPSNPTGTLVEPGEMAALAALARETRRHAARRRDLPRPHLRRGRAHRRRVRRGRGRDQQLLEVFPDDGLAAGMDAAPAGARAPRGDPGAEPLHLAFHACAARRARVLFARPRS